MRRLIFAGLTTLAIGCTSPSDDPDPPWATVVDLRVATGKPDVSAMGIAVDPTGARFLLDEQDGLYRLEAGGAVPVLALADFPDPGVEVRPPFTDLVAVGPGQFAITAIGDGFKLDLAAATMTPWFCYLPDGLPPDYQQRTDAVTYDAHDDLLYAQPITFDQDAGFAASQIAAYSGATGIDVAWHTVENDVAARGMAILPDRGLVLGQGTRLRSFDGNLLHLDLDLQPFGVSSIGGLAWDPTTESLLVVDDARDALIEISAEQLYPRTI